MQRVIPLLATMSATTVVALMMVAMATVPVFAGGGDDEENDNESANGGATRNGQIVFRRYFNAEHTKGALFVMNPYGSHIRQITHPPMGWRDDVPAWSPDGKRITFERFKSDTSTSRVMVANPDTGRTHAVVPCTVERCVYASDPEFSPDGRSIAYARSFGPPKPHDPGVEASLGDLYRRARRERSAPGNHYSEAPQRTAGYRYL